MISATIYRDNSESSKSLESSCHDCAVRLNYDTPGSRVDNLGTLRSQHFIIMEQCSLGMLRLELHVRRTAIAQVYYLITWPGN